MAGEIDKSKLYITNLPKSLSRDDLRDIFEPFGPIGRVNLVRNTTGESMRYGFVDFMSPDDGLSALSTLHGSKIDDNVIVVSFCNQKMNQKWNNNINTAELIINNLPKSFSEKDLRSLAESVGPVVSVTVVRNKAESFGFVYFRDTKDGSRALRTLNGTQLDGKSIRVSVRKPKIVREMASLSTSDSPSTSTDDVIAVKIKAGMYKVDRQLLTKRI